MLSVVPAILNVRPKAGPASVRPSAPAAPTFRKSERLSVPSEMVTSLLLLFVSRSFRQQHCVLLLPPERQLPVGGEITGGGPLATELRGRQRHLDCIALDGNPRLTAEERRLHDPAAQRRLRRLGRIADADRLGPHHQGCAADGG